MKRTFAVIFKYRRKMIFLVFIKGYLEYSGSMDACGHVEAINEVNKIIRRKFKNYCIPVEIDLEGKYVDLYEKFLV